MVQFVSTCWLRQMPKFTWWSISKLFRSTPLRSYQVTRPQKILFFHNRASSFSRTFLEPRILISQNAVTMFSVSMSDVLQSACVSADQCFRQVSFLSTSLSPQLTAAHAFPTQIPDPSTMLSWKLYHMHDRQAFYCRHLSSTFTFACTS